MISGLVQDVRLKHIAPPTSPSTCGPAQKRKRVTIQWTVTLFFVSRDLCRGAMIPAQVPGNKAFVGSVLRTATQSRALQ
jgi:hypothetical protein